MFNSGEYQQIKSPCYKCTERTMGCECKKYLQYKEEIEKFKKDRFEKNVLTHGFYCRKKRKG